MTEANDHMVDWIIKELNITKESSLLDIGCGRGKYTVEIAKKTGKFFTDVGCQFWRCYRCKLCIVLKPEGS